MCSRGGIAHASAGSVVGQFQFPQSRFSIRNCGIMVAMAQDKPSSAELRHEAEKLRATAIELMEHAARLITKSAELEKQISRLKLDNPDQSRES